MAVPRQGYKLVSRDYTPSFVRGHDNLVFKPGAEVRVDAADASRLRLRAVGLHYCPVALHCVAYLPSSASMANYRLLRVTVPDDDGGGGGSAPLLGNNGASSSLCAAAVLRVDAEVTDADERRAMLTGTICAAAGNQQRTYVDGMLVASRVTDLIGNITSETRRAADGVLDAMYGWYVLADRLKPPRQPDGATVLTTQNVPNIMTLTSICSEVVRDGACDRRVHLLHGGTLVHGRGSHNVATISRTYAADELLRLFMAATAKEDGALVAGGV